MTDNEYQGWEWKGQRIRTYGDVGRALVALESPEEAQAFMRTYAAHNVHAYENVGYLSGYYDHATMVRIQEWCQTAHPIFGRSTPTPEEALEMGKRMVVEG